MPKFFINHPVFAWVVAILISLSGVIAILDLGVESYPNIAPPQVIVSATYPGANAETVERAVTQVIEQQLTGIDNLLYFSSSSSASGSASITLKVDPFLSELMREQYQAITPGYCAVSCGHHC